MSDFQFQRFMAKHHLNVNWGKYGRFQSDVMCFRLKTNGTHKMNVTTTTTTTSATTLMSCFGKKDHHFICFGVYFFATFHYTLKI